VHKQKMLTRYSSVLSNLAYLGNILPETGFSVLDNGLKNLIPGKLKALNALVSLVLRVEKLLM